VGTQIQKLLPMVNGVWIPYFRKDYDTTLQHSSINSVLLVSKITGGLNGSGYWRPMLAALVKHYSCRIYGPYSIFSSYCTNQFNHNICLIQVDTCIELSCSWAECPPHHGWKRARGKYGSKGHISNQHHNLHCAIIAQAYLLCYIQTVQGDNVKHKQTRSSTYFSG
jgi:hypothetical protein